MSTEPRPEPIRTALPISSGAADALLHTRMMEPPSTPGDIGKIDRFEITRLLGEGGMGQVLLAREPVTDSLVAIKIIKPCYSADSDVQHRFLAEARHMYQLSHPNVLRVLEVCDRENGPYFVMPYIQGGSLGERLQRQPPVTSQEIVALATQIARALAYAHDRGIIHRDLKPANVLLDADGHAYLTDFGLARLIFNDTLVNAQQLYVEGTAPYMSPAVAAGKAEDTRCDIYSFGAMLYEMLTGRPPYLGPSPQAVIQAILTGAPPPVATARPGAHAGLAAIAQHAMARELHDRYASMADVIADLDRVAAGQPPLGPHGKARRSIRRPLIAAAMLAVVVAVLGGFAWRHHHQRLDKQPPPIARHVDTNQPAAPDTAAHDQTGDDSPALNPPVEAASSNAAAMLSQGLFNYTIADGKATITRYTGPGGNVAIPATIDGNPVSGIHSGAFRNCIDITGVTIPESVTSIGEQAFYGCSSLSSAKIPKGVTSIGREAFRATGLTSVTVPADLSSIGYSVFRDCPHLASVTIPNGVTAIERCVFSGCPELAGVTIPPSVTTIGSWAFRYCTDLTEVIFEGDAPQLEDGVFLKADKATVYYRPGTKGWGKEFGGCPTAVWDGTFVTASLPFRYKITDGKATITKYTGPGGDVTIPATIDGVPVTCIGEGAFRECTTLTSVTIPDGVTEIAGHAFERCSELTTLTIPKSVTTLDGSVVGGDPKLTAIRVDAANPAYCSDADGVVFSKDKTTLVRYPPGRAGSYTVPNFVTAIGDRAFGGSPALTSIDIPPTVTSIGSWAISSCAGLTRISLPDSITHIAWGCLWFCPKLSEIRIPESVTDIEGFAFA